MEWKTVTYGRSTDKRPSQRWGHRMVATNSNEVVLFGGFGGSSEDGAYLCDLWSFSTITHTWKSITTTGDIPECRSNYTIHYDSVSDNILLFGGGSNNKTRFNSVCLLNWKTKAWTTILPDVSESAPWERTYHSSEFSYPYLIVHGGEGVSNIDLDDLWVFNVITHKWTEIKFDNEAPRKRRFHSTALLDGYFYIFAGCTGNYQLLGDAYRVDIRRLLEKGQSSHFQWEKLISKHKYLERWGQSSIVYNGKIYVSFGRVSAYLDNSDTLCFDPVSLSLSKLDIKRESEPIARRRHAALLIGNSLLVFGGYNGKYLNDCYYLALNETQPTVINTPVRVYGSQSELVEGLKERESTTSGDVTITLTKGGETIFTLHSKRQKLTRNCFMKYWLQYSSFNLALELPSFCDVTMFRVLNQFLCEDEAVFSNEFSIEFYVKLLLSTQYFLCQQLNPFIEKQMMKNINELNCKDLLELAEEFGLKQLKLAAAELYFLKRLSEASTDGSSNHSSNHIFNSPEEPNRSEAKPTRKSTKIDEFYETIRFSIEQKRLKEQNMTFFERAANAIKAVFSKPAKQPIVVQLNHKEKQEGCLAKFAGFVTGICGNPRVHVQQRA